MGNKTETVTAAGRNGQISFDGTCVAITRNGAAAKTTGNGDRTIPLSRIDGIEFTEAGKIKTGFLRIIGPDRGRRSRQLTSANNATDPNVIAFGKKRNAEFAAVRDAINDALAAS
jgi:hypothetical protein